MFKQAWKDLLAQADPEKDCIPASLLVEDEDEEEHAAEWQAVAAQRLELAAWQWSARPRLSGRRILIGIESFALFVESALNRLIGARSLNPFYHTDTITVFLLLAVAVSGVYLAVFYVLGGIGADFAYGAVAIIDRHWLGIGRIMRGVHRYASGAAMITTLLHAVRTLFQDRFRGARWLAWVTGMLLLALMWFEGLTGYWLVWDERAQLIMASVIEALVVVPTVGVPFALNFATEAAASQALMFFVLLIFVHIALFTVLGLCYWFHVIRLNRARFLPPRYFMVALGAVLVIAALARPALSALEADLTRLPARLTIDPFFLFYLPATVWTAPALFWGALLLAFALITALPWLLRGRQQPGRVVIDKDVCTGCTKCAEDCPYNAIAMIPRQDYKPHKLIALETPNLCVSCGICVGSCDGMAVSLTDLPATDYYRTLLSRIRAVRDSRPGATSVVITCERHAAHGTANRARESVERQPGSSATYSEIFDVPCVGVLHPNVVSSIVDLGVADVTIVGCPPYDCAQREGNLWLDARLSRTRPPRLKRDYASAPIRTAWLPPNEGANALGLAPALSERIGTLVGSVQSLKPGHFVRGGLLLAFFVAVQVWLTDVPFQTAGADQSMLLLGMRNEGDLRQSTAALTGVELAALSPAERNAYLQQQGAEGRFPTRLRLEIDGRVVLDESYRALGFRQDGSSYAFGKFFLPPGDHAIRLSMDDSGGELLAVIEESVTFAPGQIHTITFDRVAEMFVLD